MGFLDCCASAWFLTRYERELREPLMWRQRSQEIRRVKNKEDSIIHHSLNRHFLKVFCGPGAELGPKATVVHKTGIVLAFTELII